LKAAERGHETDLIEDKVWSCNQGNIPWYAIKMRLITSHGDAAAKKKWFHRSPAGPGFACPLPIRSVLRNPAFKWKRVPDDECRPRMGNRLQLPSAALPPRVSRTFAHWPTGRLMQAKGSSHLICGFRSVQYRADLSWPAGNHQKLEPVSSGIEFDGMQRPGVSTHRRNAQW